MRSQLTNTKYKGLVLTYRQYRRPWIEIWFCHPVTDQQTGAWHLWTLVSWYYHCHLYQKCERHVLRRKAEKINNYLFTWLHKDTNFVVNCVFLNHYSLTFLEWTIFLKSCNRISPFSPTVRRNTFSNQRKFSAVISVLGLNK